MIAVFAPGATARLSLLCVLALLAGCTSTAPPPTVESTPKKVQQQGWIVEENMRGPCEQDADCRLFLGRGDPRCGCACEAILATASDPRCEGPPGEVGCVGNACATRRAACDRATRRCTIAVSLGL